MTEVEPDLSRGAVAAEQARYQDLFEFAPISTLVTDSDGVILEANRAAGTLLGVPSPSLVGKPISAFVSDQHRKHFRSMLLGLARGGSSAEWEHELIRNDGTPDGSVFDAQLNAAPAAHGLRWAIQDVSERVVSERRLRSLATTLEERVLERTAELERERANLDAVVEQAPIGIVILDAATRRIVRANDEAVRILDAIHGSTDELPFERVLVDGELVLEERVEFPHAELGLFTLQVSAARVRNQSGRIVSAVATLQDITEIEHRERAEREFVTNAAHELQSPVAAIVSAAEVLQAGAKDTVDRDLFLGHIE